VLDILSWCGEELGNADAVWITGPRLERIEHHQRHEHSTCPIGDLVEMEGEPARQQHDFYRHHRHGAPRYLAVKREQIARKHIAVGGAALRQDPVARTHHVRRIDQVADHLKREIGLYAGAHIRCPGVVQRPASVCRLNATEIARHFCFEGGIDRLAAIMPHQHIFGGNGGVGLKFEDEMAVWPLQRAKRLCGGGDRILQPEFDVVRGRLRKEGLWPR